MSLESSCIAISLKRNNIKGPLIFCTNRGYQFNGLAAIAKAENAAEKAEKEPPRIRTQTLLSEVERRLNDRFVIPHLSHVGRLIS